MSQTKTAAHAKYGDAISTKVVSKPLPRQAAPAPQPKPAPRREASPPPAVPRED